MDPVSGISTPQLFSKRETTAGLFHYQYTTYYVSLSRGVVAN